MIQIDVISGANEGLSQQFSQQSIRIGRQTGNDLNLNDNRVSSQHCVISVEGGNVYITDLQSSNGTFVSGRRVTAKAPIFPGDQIQIGDTVLGCSFLQQQATPPPQVQQPQYAPQQQTPPQMQTPQQPITAQQQMVGEKQEKKPSKVGKAFKFGCTGLGVFIVLGTLLLLAVAILWLASALEPIAELLRIFGLGAQ